MSNVMEKLSNHKFTYEEPFFYTNEMSIRCELKIENDKDYLKNATQRAFEIISILFHNQINTFFYNNYISDYDYADRLTCFEMSNIKRYEENRLIFNLNMLHKYDHKVIRNVKINKANDDDMLLSVNRIICFSKEPLNIEEVVLQNFNGNNSTIHFISEENECIMSIYDERGCDIVFFNKSQYLKFYGELEKYFLEYDKEKCIRNI